MPLEPSQSVARGGLLLTASSVVFMLSGYVINIWLGRTLEPADYGIYGVIISLMTAVNIIQTSGLPQATSKHIAAGQTDADDVLRASLHLQLASTAVISVGFWLAAPLLAQLLRDPLLTPYLQATSLILPGYALFALYVGYYNGRHEFRRQALLTTVYSLAKLALVVGLVLRLRLYGAIAGFILAPVVALGVGFRVPHGQGELRGRYRRLATDAVPLIGFAVLTTLLISVDLFFVKSFVPDAPAAGLYAASQNIARIPYFALSAFALVLFPTVSRSVRAEDHGQTQRRVRSAVRYLLLLLVPATVLIAATSGPLLEWLYSASYLGAAPALAWLAVGLACLTVFTVLASVINAAGSPATSTMISALALALTVGVCRWLVPQQGMVGAALATTAGGLVAMLVALWVLLRRFPGLFDWPSALRIGVATFGMYAAGAALRLPTDWLPVTYLGLATVYGVSLLLLREITSADLAMVRRLLRGQATPIIPHD